LFFKEGGGCELWGMGGWMADAVRKKISVELVE
jgi:hypothetical protein